MAQDIRLVRNAAELAAALKLPARTAPVIVVSGKLNGVPGFTLPPGWSIVGHELDTALSFAVGSDGILLTKDNRLRAVRVEVDPVRRAVYNDTDEVEGDFGTITLNHLDVVGRVEIGAGGSIRSGHVRVEHLTIENADTRDLRSRVRGYGTHVVPGAFTLYNAHPKSESLVTADLFDLSAGVPGAPVRGSGMLLSGSEGGGRVECVRLTTGPVICDGGIPRSTVDRVSGAVFVAHARVREVTNEGPITTFGAHDAAMCLWGEAQDWVVTGPMTTYGANAPGFANFGHLRRLRVTSPVETFGAGAHGFATYDGTVDSAEFDRITTHANAGTGARITATMGSLTIHNGVETHGALGDCVISGTTATLPAAGVSVAPGAHVRAIFIGGGVTTHGPGMPALDLFGDVDVLTIPKGVRAIAPYRERAGGQTAV